MSASPEPTPRLTLEDLLRLKRAERPDDAFWSEFDHGLRQKQLAAIVEPKPWWLGVSLVVRKFALPVGAMSGVSAAAAALFAIIALAPSDTPNSGMNTGLNAPVEIAALDVENTAAAPLGSSLSELGEASEVHTFVTTEPVSPSEGSLVADSGAGSPSERGSTAYGSGSGALRVVSVTPKRDVLSTALASVAVGPSFFSLPSSIAGLASGEDVAVLFESGEFSGVSGGAGTLFAAVDELKSLPETAVALSDLPDRQARLLAVPAISTTETGAVTRARERIVRNLSDSDELYASVTRLGVRGDRLSVRF